MKELVKEFAGSSFDIDRVIIYNEHVPFIFIGLLDLGSGVRFTHRKQCLS
jgi:hypothetical protein